MKNLINVYKLGKLDYKKCLNIQKYLVKKHLNNENDNIKDSILLVEHEPVYTIGIRRQNYSKNQLNELKLKTNASIEITDRGGLITYHGLGQMVAYPILNLKNYKPSLKWYVSKLEQTVINMCKSKFDIGKFKNYNILVSIQ
jgi:lipoyl(octanoyl) transferase 2